MDTSLSEVNHAWEILFIFMLMKLRDGYHDAKDPASLNHSCSVRSLAQ